MSNIHTAIIIVNHNNEKSIVKLIDSIYRYESLNNKKIIFVQNTQSKFISNYIRNFNDIILIQNKIAKGFSENVNSAINYAKEKFNIEYFLLLNPDIELKNKMLSTFVSFYKENDNIGIIAPKLFNDDGTIQYSCRRFYNVGYILIRMFRLGIFFGYRLEDKILMKDFSHSKISDVDWVVGACMFFSNSFIEKVGLFDDRNYFLYFEDQDICLRSWRKNLRVIYYPDISCSHSNPRRGSSLMLSKHSIYQLKSAFNIFRKFNFNLKR
jgi:N-acetylglucosaminyl-diphospho-decaprenol L-rhamnosyltransferase